MTLCSETLGDDIYIYGKAETIFKMLYIMLHYLEKTNSISSETESLITCCKIYTITVTKNIVLSVLKFCIAIVHVTLN